MSQTLSLSIQQQVQLRFLCPNDIPETKLLCADWFPIEYPDTWFEDITSSPRFYSLAATISNVIIGMIVCEVKPRTRCNREDADILASHFPPTSQVAYILSLGVVQDFRRHGIASVLLDNLLSYLTSSEQTMCKAVYLHVLTTNKTAIQFYERRNFRLHNFLPFYYSISGNARDGYCYVSYINGGQPPWSLLDGLHMLSEFLSPRRLCKLPQRLYGSLFSWLRSAVTSSPTKTRLTNIRYS